MNTKKSLIIVFLTAFLLVNVLQVSAVTVYRENVVYPSGWFEDMSLPYREMKFAPFYLDEGLCEMEIGDYELDNARKWGYKTIDEYDEGEKVTVYATGKRVTIPEFLKEAYLKVGWFEELITLYAPDDRTLEVTPYDKYTYLNLGWYEKPVKTLYALDGRQQVFYDEGVEAQCTVGWYKEKPIPLYALDGRIQYFPPEAVEAQCAVGWYKEAPVTLYTLDGRSKVFPVGEADKQRSVGWYYKNEIDRMKELENLAKTFFVGQRVWMNTYAAYTPVGYVKSVNGGNVSVKWDYFYDWESFRVYDQQEILIAERVTGIVLGETYAYSADRIKVYK